MEFEKLDDQELLATLVGSYSALAGNKPNDHSERDRRFAIVITEMERVIAYFRTYVVERFEVK